MGDAATGTEEAALEKAALGEERFGESTSGKESADREMQKTENPIYLDWAATAPLCEEARSAMEPFLVPGISNLPHGGNANSLHSSGRFAFTALEDARRAIAGALKVPRPDEILFTSGATEADNAALLGIVSAAVKLARHQGLKGYVPHIITSSIEHDAVLAPARILEALGCEVTVVEPDRQGFVDARSIEAAFRDTTALVSIHMANNEIGSVQAIRRLAAVTHDAGALFHTDAVQALGKVPVDIASLDVDAASFSAHKIGGPKGIGALYLRTMTPFDPVLVGGGQEAGKRSGTQNVCGAVGFAAACTAAVRMQEAEGMRLMRLRDRLYEALSGYPKVSPSVEVEPGSRDYLPNIVGILVDGLESETMILRLDMAGVEVSGGSACSSHSLEPSHVLRAIGHTRDEAHGSLRISMGRYTTEDDIERFLQAFSACLDSK